MVKSGRPRSVTYVLLGGLLLGGWNLWRALVLVQHRPLLHSLGVTLDPLWRLAMALLWAVLFIVGAGAIWSRRPWARWLFPLCLFFYAVYHFILLLFFVQSPVARQSWGADAIVYMIAIVGVVWALYRPGTRYYWRLPPPAPTNSRQKEAEVIYDRSKY